MEELRGVAEKWRLIGRKLGVRGVDNIRYPDPTDCLREVVRRELSPYTTWRYIIGALRSAGEAQLADSLKAKYIPGELTPQHHHNIHLSLNMRNVYCYIISTLHPSSLTNSYPHRENNDCLSLESQHGENEIM